MKKRLLTLFIYLLFACASLQSQSQLMLSTASGEILNADIKNCTTQVLCNVTGMPTSDIAYCNNTLYGTDAYSIFEIQTSNCSFNAITDTLTNKGDFVTALLTLNDSEIIAATLKGNLLKVNVQTGKYFTIGIIAPNNASVVAYGSSGDLIWHKNDLLMVALNNDLIRIELDSMFSKIEKVALVGNMNANGVSLYGLASIVSDSCSNEIQIFAFGGLNAYLVNPENAQTQIACNLLTHANIAGAAVTNEYHQNIITESILLANIFTPNNDGINDEFHFPENIDANQIRFSIYDRWGTFLYFYEGEELKWDGNDKNNLPCKAGIYFYTLTFNNKCNIPKVANGTLTLMR